MKRSMIAVLGVVAVLVAAMAAGTASAITIDMVTVGNPGNAGEWSGGSYGGYGPDRICGAVSYAYNIGKYEVTAAQYTAFLNSVAATDTYGLYNTNMWVKASGCKIQQSGSSGSYTYSVASDWANRPVNYVTYWDSCRFANWLGNGQGNGDTETGAYTLNGYNGTDGRTIQRNAGWTSWAVASEDEWYKAAYYDPNKGGPGVTGYWDYPTMSNDPPGQDMADVSGNNANYDTYPNAYPIDSGKYYTTVAGEFQNSDSPYGTFDQGGNVWEWTEAVIGIGNGNRGIRGGARGYDASVLHAADRSECYPSWDYWSDTGFRVVTPEPATMALLALGGIGTLLRRRRNK